MDEASAFPSFDAQFPELNRFILQLTDLYNEGKLRSWEELEEQVTMFFTPARMDQMETDVPGWKKMASYSDGVTLVHVMCVFLGMYMMPEFINLSPVQKDLMKWIILFHDIDKSHIRGEKDPMHAFRSGTVTASLLPQLGFPLTNQYPELIDLWSENTVHAYIVKDGETAPTPDNRKLPDILQGIEQIFGENTPATLIVKTVLLHISLHVDDQYPTPAPLTKEEIKRYIDPDLFPLLKVMMLSDNEGWSLFNPETRTRQRKDTLAAFEEVQRLLA